MKPDWKTLPSWATWLAMDGDGYWCWFEHKPEFDQTENQWMLAEDTPVDSRYNNAKEPDEDGIDWDFAFDTLEVRPEDSC